MKQNELFQLNFTADAPEKSQAQVDLTATFTWQNGEKTKTVKGFYNGNSQYIVRFLPEEIGEYTWQTSGIISQSGKETCTIAENQKAPVGVLKAKGRQFVDANGTQFNPFGTTIYALAHQEAPLIEQTMKTLDTAPFNKVRHCVFPKHYNYNHNEPELFAFEKDENGKWDVHKPCFAFWAHFEKIITDLASKGIQTDLILFHPYDRWGFAEMPREDCLVYLDYLLRRLSAMPTIWWSLANEFDLMFKKTMEDWFAFEEFVAENDPYNHLLSNHNCFGYYDFTRKNITHCCVQTTQVESAGKWLAKYEKPLMYDEVCYEGDLPLAWGNISAFEMANRFWIASIKGAYVTHGEVFLSDDDILWWARGGVLKGQSAPRIAFLRNIIESLPSAIEPWETRCLDDLPEEFKEVVMSGVFEKAHKTMDEAQAESQLVKEGAYASKCGDKVFMQYLARHCNSVLTLPLPKDKSYRVEVIDMWEMTRTTAIEKASGSTTVKLPGKEGMAVIATLIEE